MSDGDSGPSPSNPDGSELPFAFVVAGIPLSAQARRKDRWISRVRRAASAKWNNGQPLKSEVSVLIVYYYTDTSLDVDNLAKPILDAMKGLIFEDDGLVSQLIARKTELENGLRVIGAPPTVVDALSGQDDFVYVRVAGPPNHGILP